MLKLRELRKERGLTQQIMANLLQMTQAAYSKLEREEYKMNIDMLAKLADILECSTDALLGRSNSKEVFEKNAIKYFNMMIDKDQDE